MNFTRHLIIFIVLQGPRYGHHIEDITEYIDGKHEDRLQRLINWVNESKEEELTGFIGGPPCPDFSVAGKNRGRDGENGRLSGTYAQLICTAKTSKDYIGLQGIDNFSKS